MHTGKLLGENRTHDHMLVRRLVLIDLHPGQILVNKTNPRRTSDDCGNSFHPIAPGDCGALRANTRNWACPADSSSTATSFKPFSASPLEEVAGAEYSSIQMVVILSTISLRSSTRPASLPQTLHRQRRKHCFRSLEGTTVRLVESMEESVADAVGHLRVCFFVLHFT